MTKTIIVNENFHEADFLLKSFHIFFLYFIRIKCNLYNAITYEQIMDIAIMFMLRYGFYVLRYRYCVIDILNK